MYTHYIFWIFTSIKKKRIYPVDLYNIYLKLDLSPAIDIHFNLVKSVTPFDLYDIQLKP